MNRTRTPLAVASSLAALGFVQAENVINDHQPPRPSVTKPRLAPPVPWQKA